MSVKDLEHYPKYLVTGTGNAILSNRISYFYNLHVSLGDILRFPSCF